MDSPCWDAGTNQIEIDGVVYYAPDQDFEGTERPGDTGVDIGADEDLMGVGVDELQVEGGEADRNPAKAGLQVFPNPAFGRSNIKYQISESKSVLIQVYDIHGAVVCTLVNEKQSSGEHSIYFNASVLLAGLYCIRFQEGRTVATQKFVVLSN